MTSGKLENIIKYTKNLNVLYVEDNIYVQQQTIKMLESFFNNIYIASNGKEALDLFDTNNLYNLGSGSVLNFTLGLHSFTSFTSANDIIA